MSASKPTIKTKSLEGLLMLFEVSENFEDESIDTIEGLLKNKNVKVSKIITTKNLSKLNYFFV